LRLLRANTIRIPAFLLGLLLCIGWPLACAEQHTPDRAMGLSGANASAGCQGGLFSDATRPATVSLATDPTIVRARFVKIDLPLLVGAPRPLELNLFPDICFTAVPERTESSPPNKATWIGRVSGVPHSQVTLVLVDNVVAGNITLPGKLYQVRYVGNGVHAILEIDQRAFRPD
jgi:hypothetical protein